jgi:hypothetical protein
MWNLQSEVTSWRLLSETSKCCGVVRFALVLEIMDSIGMGTAEGITAGTTIEEKELTKLLMIGGHR